MNYRKFLGTEIRKAITGQTVGPSLVELLKIFDPEIVRKRLRSYALSAYDSQVDQILVVLCLVLFMEHYLDYTNTWSVGDILLEEGL